MKRLSVIHAFIFAVTSLSAQVYLDPTTSVEERVQDALSRMTTHEKIQILHAQSKFTSAGVPRLGIRQLNMDDGPHGVREELEWNTWKPAGWTNDFVVAFPSLTCLASTWNRELSKAYGTAVSEEFAFRGKDIMLGPGVNIARTPMNGRAFEYMGEDPFLAGEMVVPYIQAAQSNGVACCLKHFVLNDQETDRFGVNVNVSERALREIYLLPFYKAVRQANVYTIMGSYNYWQNVHCCQNDTLLNGILKNEWQWNGALVSDWGGTTDTWQAATGGLDIEMGTYTDGKTKESEFGYKDYHLANRFERLIEEGKIPMSVLNDKAARVLRTIFRTSMNPRKVIGSQCSEAHYDVCRQIGEEGIVLLKNGKGLLPLDTRNYRNILVVGENATRSLTKGGGSSELKTLTDRSPLDAIQAAFGNGTTVSYAQGYESGRALYDKVDKVSDAKNEQLKAEALAKADEADLIIFIGGLNKNHKQDCENGDRESYNLPFGQDELIEQLSQHSSAPLVVVTFGGNPFATPWLQQTNALLHCWYLGSEAGTALANVLTGKTCPSGKLPVTFGRRYEDYPYVRFGAEAYPGVSDTDTPFNSAGEKPRSQVFYKEGIFVGYRGFEKNKTQPLFPFGYGLSYTTFNYGKPTVTITDNGSIDIDVTVSNSGKVAGKETVQVYVASPLSKRADMPLKQLKAFAKTRLLQPGERETLHMNITREELSYWDEATHQWTCPSGTYTIMTGASSADIRGKADVTIPPIR